MAPASRVDMDVAARSSGQVSRARWITARRGVTGIAALLAAVALSGCSAPGASYAVLDEPASAMDALPTDLPDYAFDEVDRASARSVGVHDATSLWLLRGTDRSICLFAYADSGAWAVACGGETGVTTSGAAGHFQVVPDGAPEPNNGTRVSDNVYALG